MTASCLTNRTVGGDPERAGRAADDRASYERQFIRELGTIKSAVACIARRHHLSPVEAEELTSEAYLKIVEDDYAVLRKFQGRSSLRTYLAAVVSRVHLDSRVKRWGKWRPSSAARRQGPTAMLFERLINEQGLSLEEARAVMESAHGLSIDAPALEALAAALPRRPRRRDVPAEALERIASNDPDSASSLEQAAFRATAARTWRALTAELVALSHQDRRLLRRRFVDDARLCEVAHESAEVPKAIYRRLARVLATLRRRLESRGISRADVLELLGRPLC